MVAEAETRETGLQPHEDAPMFAATPVWDRPRKRRGPGAAHPPSRTVAVEPRPAETRSFSPARYPEDDAMTGIAGAAGAARPDAPFADPDSAPFAPPPARTTTAASSSGSGRTPAMVAGGVAALALIAGAGWYVSRPHDNGVPELAPGEPATSQVAVAPLSPSEPAIPVTPQDRMAEAYARQTAPAPSRAGPADAAPRQMARAARVRPAVAPSAGDSAANASAVLPDAPRPYSTLNPSAPLQVTPPVSTPPVDAAPAVPETPPSAPAPETPVTPETAPPTT